MQDRRRAYASDNARAVSVTLRFDPSCSRCLLAEGPRSVGRHACVPGDGPVPCDILFYGEAPGANEEVENRPFVGDAGVLLDEILGTAGLARSKVYIGNVVRCRPPGNRDPTTGEVEACRLYTTREIESVQPKVIVALGGVALKALTGKTAIGENRGKLLLLLPAYRSRVRVIPSYHPASILHQPSIRSVRKQQIADDMLLAKKYAQGGEFDAKIVTNQEKVPRALELLQRCPLLAVDCEWEVFPGREIVWPWSRQNGQAPQLISYGLAGRVEGRVLACSVPADSPHAAQAKELIGTIPTVYHNAIADLIWLLAQGVRPIVAGCTMILAFLLNVQSSLSLKALAPTLTSVPAGWEDDVVGLLGVVPQTEEEWQRVLEYNAKDAVATLLLREALEAKAEGNPVMPLYREVLLPAAYYLSQASLAGVPFDVEYLADLEVRAKAQLKKLQERIRDVVGSSKQIDIAYAVERLANIELPLTAKTSRPSLSEEALAPHVGRHQLVGDLVKEGKLKKLHGSYLKPIGSLLAEQGDRRLHSVYRLAVARTGRTSAEQERGGTIQQYPRPKRIRQAVRARDGWKIMVPDQSQVELRVVAWLAQEKQMLQFFRDDKDIHTYTASWIRALAAGRTLQQWRTEMADWVAKVTPEDRQAAKATNFGFDFGMQEEGFIKQALKEYGIVFTPEGASLARRGYFELYADLPAWHDEAWKWVHLGYVDTPDGRRRLLPEEDEAARHRKSINTPVQCFASDLSLDGMVGACRALERAGLFGTSAILLGFIHDAALFEVRDEALVEVESIVKREMEHPALDRIGAGGFLDSVPLKVDFKIDQVWA